VVEQEFAGLLIAIRVALAAGEVGDAVAARSRVM